MNSIIVFLGTPAGLGIISYTITAIGIVFCVYFYYRPKLVEANNKSKQITLDCQKIKEKLVDDYISCMLSVGIDKRLIDFFKFDDSMIKSFSCLSINKEYYDVNLRKFTCIKDQEITDKEKIKFEWAIIAITILRDKLNIPTYLTKNDYLPILVLTDREKSNNASLMVMQDSLKSEKW